MNNSEFIKPFMRWAGGKQNIVKSLINHLPNNKVNRYFEPFLGAGSLFLATNYNKSFLSDINGHLINSFNAVKTDPIRIYNLLQTHRKYLSRDYYYKVRDEYNKNINDFSLEQAARFIFLIHTSFNGIYRVNKQGLYNVPVGKLSPILPTLEHLKKVSKKLTSADLATCSYSEILGMVKENDFVYIDPPYPPLNSTSSFRHYTIDRFPNDEQEKVVEFAYQLDKKGCFVLISNADTKFILNIYKGWKYSKVVATRYVSCKSSRKKVNELIMKNY